MSGNLAQQLPYLLESEQVVLSAVVLTPNGLDRVRPILQPADFSRSHATIYQAALNVAAREEAIDIVALANQLRSAGKLEGVGGAVYLAEMLDSAPAVGNLEQHAQAVREVSGKRRLVHLLQRAAAQAVSGTTDTSKMLAALREDVEQMLGAGGDTALPLISTMGIFARLEPIEYLLRPLDFCPGAPVLIAGYGFSGKTVAAQALALSVAAGAKVWGTYDVEPGKVLHIDFEQGSRLTCERYQRLAHALMLAPQDLAGRLSLASMPKMYLDTAEAETTLRRASAGHRMVLVDSLRAAAPTVDENSSDARRVLDMLTRVSEATGATFVVIHHARKPQREATGGAKASIRGSGAIFDACGSVLVFEGSKGEPVRVSHEKARASGVLADDIELVIEDVPDGHNPRAGLNVTAQGISLDEPDSAHGGGVGEQRRAEHDARVLELVAANPAANSRALRGLARPMRNTEIDDAIGRLISAGKVEVQSGLRGAILHFVRGAK